MDRAISFIKVKLKLIILLFPFFHIIIIIINYINFILIFSMIIKIRYFFYQLVNIVLIFTVVGTIFNTISDILNDPKSIITILAEQFPKVHF